MIFYRVPWKGTGTCILGSGSLNWRTCTVRFRFRFPFLGTCTVRFRFQFPQKIQGTRNCSPLIKSNSIIIFNKSLLPLVSASYPWIIISHQYINSNATVYVRTSLIWLMICITLSHWAWFYVWPFWFTMI